ncbi:MAG: HDIG domain-containing protein [Proteobacteria bacterium]|nr:HDIG domain-containing protein [Pseudomonadota bacterium]
MDLKINTKPFFKFLVTKRQVLWFLLIFVTLIFTFFLNPNLTVKQHSYKLGDIAKRDVKAPKDFYIEDTVATEFNRKQAIDSVLTVYDHDTALLPDLKSRVFHAFKELKTLLSPEEKPLEESAGTTETAPRMDTKVIPSDDELKTIFEDIVGTSISSGAFQILKKDNFSTDISEIINKIITEIIENGVVTNKEILLKEQDKGIILRSVGTNEETVVRNLKRIYGLDQAKTMVRIIGEPLLKDTSSNLKNLIVDFSQKLIQPNITLNKNETENRLKASEAEVKSVLYMIKEGEMLLREGERVTMPQLIKLKNLETQTKQKHIVTSSVGTAMLILCFLMISYVLHFKRQKKMDRNLNKHLFFLALILLAFLFMVKMIAFLPITKSSELAFAVSDTSLAYSLPMAAATMTICLFLGIEIAIPFALILSVFATIIFQNKFEIFVYFFLQSAMATFWIQDCRERKVFIKAGLKISLLNIILITAIDIYMDQITGERLLWGWIFGFASGIMSGIITSGITPIIEILFDYSTDIKLLELANLDKPILRRLMIEAPGTYNHSVIVGTMAEAAASEIQANPLLTRVCGYYHDVGKITKPLYFIENQTPGKNKHDKLAPSMSALIITAHIKDGVEIAKKEKLGADIVDTIRQHHGTSLLSFFFEKAKQLKGAGQTVNSEDFRYPGPKPQTRETAIVMLADVVEAASRTLDNPTPSRIQGLVQNLINKIFIDGQLDECELTLKDLHSIAKSFNKILNGIYHHRIEYAETTATQQEEKKEDERSDNKQADQPKNFPDATEEKGQSHIKRLGIS